MPPLFNDPEVLLTASDKANLFTKNFSENSNFDALGISFPVFPTNLILHNISLTPKIIKKVVIQHSKFTSAVVNCLRFC